MSKTNIPLEIIRERDIDLILLEELETDSQFLHSFVDLLGLPKLLKPEFTNMGVFDFGLGESDILLSYHSDEGKIFVLLENKIGATFQENQYSRYLRRGEKYLQQKECDQYFVALVAPEYYCTKQNQFDRFLTYEDIIKQLQTQDTKRSLFKSRIMQTACEKSQRSYHPINSDLVQKFWHQYWTFKEELFPDLIMKKPVVVPHNSDWPIVHDPRLKNINFIHKLAQGNVDASFKKKSDKLRDKILEILPEWASLENHGKSFSLRVFSGIVDREESFEKQKPTVLSGLQNISRMRDWILENRIFLDA